MFIKMFKGVKDYTAQTVKMVKDDTLNYLGSQNEQGGVNTLNNPYMRIQSLTGNKAEVVAQPQVSFIMGGRTGGPLLPPLAMIQGIAFFNPTYPVIVGIRGGFEQKYAIAQNLPIEYLPEAKLSILTFKGLSFLEIIKELFLTVWMIIKLIWSFFSCILLIRRYQPKLIVQSGSFLGVPMIFAAFCLNSLLFSRVKIIVHQQDVAPSLSNKLVARFADQITYVFDQSAVFFDKHKAKLKKIPNPIDIAKFDPNQMQNIIVDPFLDKLLSQNNPQASKPVAMIFGGGSGAKAINDWVFSNLTDLLTKYRVIHLTGAIQDIDNLPSSSINDGYLALKVLTDNMPIALYYSDLVIARAGMGTITELTYLNKPGFLIPLPASHQEANAQAVEKLFVILEQKNMGDWLDVINKNFPSHFQSLQYPSKRDILEELDQYYYQVAQLVFKS
jgi:UDP-N-acetylglucosamine--N-acetylmuramyl-(pentapeptide) pyrophosphoryl-undecaprenol N-acetylglucosamine transferase